ncbi:MAG: hypothetical protein HF978_18160 [Desulfobacteraceae bacterium]|nr:hypothetical protein [Desulfobacteraceae bacterium]MBC2757473.1 hypothetical protein [Desulfobacteraceae bacterium]
MNKRLGIFVMVLAVLSLPAHLVAGPVDDYLKVVSADSDGLILEIQVPAPDIEAVWEGGVLYHRMTVPGLGTTADVGRPQLPLKGALIGVPGTDKPDIEVLASDSLTLPDYNIYPVPRPVLVDEDDREKRLTYEFVKDTEAYHIDAFVPSRIAEIGFTGFMRDQRVARMKLFPFQFNPITGELRYHYRITVRVNFNGQPQTAATYLMSVTGKKAERPSAKGRNGAYEGLLKGLLLNYDQIRQ